MSGFELPGDYDTWRTAHDPSYDQDERDVCPNCMGTGEVSRVVHGKWSVGLGGELAYFECGQCGGDGRR